MSTLPIINQFCKKQFDEDAMYTLKCHTWSTSGGRIPKEI